MKYEIMSKSKLFKSFSIQNLCQLSKSLLQSLLHLGSYPAAGLLSFSSYPGSGFFDKLQSGSGFFDKLQPAAENYGPVMADVDSFTRQIFCWFCNRHRNRHHEKYLFSTVIIRKIEFISQKIGFLGYKVGYNLGGSLFGHSIFKSHIPSSLRHQGKPSNT